jgi:hypothetical protein
LLKPTREDAELYLKLFQLFPLQAWLWLSTAFSVRSYEEFTKKYPRESEGFGKVVQLLGFYEVAGALVSHGLLNENLFFDAPFGLEVVWERLRPVIAGWRSAAGPGAWENAAWLANRRDVWVKTVWKPNQAWKTEEY